MNSFTVTGKYTDLFEKRIYPAAVKVKDGKIVSVRKTDVASENYILPGFVDAHIHIESSMLTPSSFAAIAVKHGTVATVSDPHEIANVAGIDGVRYMIECTRNTNFKIFYGAPSCVPATSFESAGAVIDAKAVEQMLQQDDIWYLSEMMNYPGVLSGDEEVIAKLNAAKKVNKQVDGHAPGLTGAQAHAYANVGISTDHECFTLEEAQDKIAAGMHILIREGSAAKNFNALCDLIKLNPDKIMFCSDDKHPDELMKSHINELVKRAVKLGYNIFDVLKIACVNPILHYNLPVGMLREGDPADFIVVNNLIDFEVKQTYINGTLVADKGESILPFIVPKQINNFKATKRNKEDFAIKASTADPEIRIIEVIEGQLVTNEARLPALTDDGYIVSDVSRDIIKLCVINRYEEHAPVAFGFIKNLGLKYGAIASTIGHDSHNIIAAGVDDASICAVVNAVIHEKGGIAATNGKADLKCLPLPIAGLMSAWDAHETAAAYEKINAFVKTLGTPLQAPFMTLSFMPLLVIPHLKLSDKGLFDVTTFSFTELETGK